MEIANILRLFSIHKSQKCLSDTWLVSFADSVRFAYERRSSSGVKGWQRESSNIVSQSTKYRMYSDFVMIRRLGIAIYILILIWIIHSTLGDTYE